MKLMAGGLRQLSKNCAAYLAMPYSPSRLPQKQVTIFRQARRLLKGSQNPA
jgi:hypothetical protein